MYIIIYLVLNSWSPCRGATIGGVQPRRAVYLLQICEMISIVIAASSTSRVVIYRNSDEYLLEPTLNKCHAISLTRQIHRARFTCVPREFPPMLVPLNCFPAVVMGIRFVKFLRYLQFDLQRFCCHHGNFIVVEGIFTFTNAFVLGLLSSEFFDEAMKIIPYLSTLTSVE